MCFSQGMSFSFAALGLFLAWYVWKYTCNTQLAVGVFYFFLMEFLQGFQYIWINDCDSPINKFLTFLGFVHIAYQPYFTHVINSSLSKNPKILLQYAVVLRLCLVGGTMLLARYFLAIYGDSVHEITSAFGDWKFPLGDQVIGANSCRTGEWLNGEELCTYKGTYHLAWSVPMAPATYWVPAASIHSFLMFVPFFVMKWNMVVQGVFLWLAGPFLASYFTDNLQEQASIWCFFSIAQIAVMLFLIREQLILSWGTGGHKDVSLHVEHKHATMSSSRRGSSRSSRSRSRSRGRTRRTYTRAEPEHDEEEESESLASERRTPSPSSRSYSPRRTRSMKKTK